MEKPWSKVFEEFSKSGNEGDESSGDVETRERLILGVEKGTSRPTCRLASRKLVWLPRRVRGVRAPTVIGAIFSRNERRETMELAFNRLQIDTRNSCWFYELALHGELTFGRDR